MGITPRRVDHKVTHQLALSQAIANLIHYKEAVGRSEHTFADYHSTRKKLLEFFAIHTNCSSLWAWAGDEKIVERNLLRTVEPPAYEPPLIVEFTRDELAVLLKACDVTRNWRTRNAIASHRPTADEIAQSS